MENPRDIVIRNVGPEKAKEFLDQYRVWDIKKQVKLLEESTSISISPDDVCLVDFHEGPKLSISTIQEETILDQDNFSCDQAVQQAFAVIDTLKCKYVLAEWDINYPDYFDCIEKRIEGKYRFASKIYEKQMPMLGYPCAKKVLLERL